MEYQMKLTPEQQEILNGSRGETMAKVCKRSFVTASCLVQMKWFL